MKWAIRGKVGMGFGLALLILVVIGVVAYRSTTQLIDTARLVSRTHRLLEALESVCAHMSDIETGARGYVITGEDRYLEPYYSALVELARDLSDLGHFVGHDPNQEEYVDLLETLVEGKIAQVRAMIDLRRQSGAEIRQQMMLMDQGKVVMDTIRVVILAATKEGRAMLARQDELANQRARSTTMTIVVGSLLALTLVAGATIVINRDITGLRRTEAALRKSEERYHTLIKNFPNGAVLLFDHELRYTIADGAGLAALGLSKDALEGKTVWEAFPPEISAVIAPLHRAALVGEERSVEVSYADRIHSVYTLPIRNEAGEIFAGMMMSQDITQRKEVERLKDEFISTVSHELRTPLSSLRGFAELLLEREFPPERRQRFVAIIHSETVRLTNLINDFLDLQRMELGRQVYHFEGVDVRELLHEAIALFTPGEAQVVWSLEVHESLPPAQADRDRIRQVLANLLSNALKYSPRGGEVTVGAREQGGYVEVRVTDHGVGIPPEAIPQLFSKFFRVDNSQTRHVGGTGLGLALVKEIVDAHQGRVWVESTPDHGSTFFFTLPVAVQPLPAVVVPEGPGGDATDVLLVENDPVFTQLLRERFQGAGLSVATTSYAERALDLTRLSPPRMLLVDIHLAGDMDGWDLLVALKSDPIWQAIPIILITTSEEANLRGLALAGADYLPRPVSTAGLRRAIQRQLPSLSGKRVMVADDDRAFRRQVVELLADAPDAKVVEATNGLEALQQVAQQVPDLLLLDLLMPDMDGFEVLQQLRADKRAMNMAVLVVTSKDLLPAEKAHLKRKMASLVSKNDASLDHFARIVGRVLGS